MNEKSRKISMHIEYPASNTEGSGFETCRRNMLYLRRFLRVN